jgi:hypothetical protein
MIEVAAGGALSLGCTSTATTTASAWEADRFSVLFEDQ